MVCATFFCFAAEAAYSTVRHHAIVQVVWTRYSVHLLTLLLLLGPRRFYRRIGTRRLGLHVTRGLLMIAMPFFGFAALANMAGAEFKAVFWLLPLSIVAISGIKGGRRIRIWHWLVITAAYLGLLVIFRPDPMLFNIEMLFALGSSLSFGIYIVLTYRLQTTERLSTNLIYTALAVVGPLTPLLPRYWQMPSLVDGIKMFIVGVLGLTCLWFIEKALEYSLPASLAPVLYLIPLWGLTVRLLWKGIVPGLPMIFGAAVVLACLLSHYLLMSGATERFRHGPDQQTPPP
jgi:drug/metabolite transporter (DMT)-like permease